MSPAPDEPRPSGTWPLGWSAPSWAYQPHGFPNGHAVTSVVAGIVGAVFVSMPGGLLLLPGIPVTALAVWAGIKGLARARRTPALGGRTTARIGLVCAAAGPALLVVWIALGIW